MEGTHVCRKQRRTVRARAIEKKTLIYFFNPTVLIISSMLLPSGSAPKKQARWRGSLFLDDRCFYPIGGGFTLDTRIKIESLERKLTRRTALHNIRRLNCTFAVSLRFLNNRFFSNGFLKISQLSEVQLKHAQSFSFDVGNNYLHTARGQWPKFYTDLNKHSPPLLLTPPIPIEI
jgi:hypothetical protein